MEFIKTEFEGLYVIQPRVFTDERGEFFESFNAREFNKKIAEKYHFVQDNHSISIKNVLRGLHYQVGEEQGKLVRVVEGEVYDVVVDLRRSSNTFGKWFGLVISSNNRKQIWIPPGFAHGFLSLSDKVEFLYKTTGFYNPEVERCILWNDSDLGIDWPEKKGIIVSDKDKLGVAFSDAEYFE